MSTVTVLFWNNQGAIACDKHAPGQGTDTWLNQQWQTMTVSDRLDWAATVRLEAKCECCR